MPIQVGSSVYIYVCIYVHVSIPISVCLSVVCLSATLYIHSRIHPSLSYTGIARVHPSQVLLLKYLPFGLGSIEGDVILSEIPLETRQQRTHVVEQLEKRYQLPKDRKYEAACLSYFLYERHLVGRCRSVLLDWILSAVGYLSHIVEEKTNAYIVNQVIVSLPPTEAEEQTKADGISAVQQVGAGERKKKEGEEDEVTEMSSNMEVGVDPSPATTLDRPSPLSITAAAPPSSPIPTSTTSLKLSLPMKRKEEHHSSRSPPTAAASSSSSARSLSCTEASSSINTTTTTTKKTVLCTEPSSSITTSTSSSTSWGVLPSTAAPAAVKAKKN